MRRPGLALHWYGIVGRSVAMVRSEMFCTPDGAPSSAVSGHVEPLPAWNLADLYDGVDSSALLSDLEGSKSRAAAFRTVYAGKLEGLTAAALAEALQQYE